MDPLPIESKFRPVHGLKRITWPQLEKIDELIDLACLETEPTRGEARLMLIIKAGKLRFIEHPLIRSELKPNRGGDDEQKKKS